MACCGGQRELAKGAKGKAAQGMKYIYTLARERNGKRQRIRIMPDMKDE